MSGFRGSCWPEFLLLAELASSAATFARRISSSRSFLLERLQHDDQSLPFNVFQRRQPNKGLGKRLPSLQRYSVSTWGTLAPWYPRARYADSVPPGRAGLFGPSGSLPASISVLSLPYHFPHLVISFHDLTVSLAHEHAHEVRPLGRVEPHGRVRGQWKRSNHGSQ